MRARAWRARAMRAGKRHAYLDNLPDPTFCPAFYSILINICITNLYYKSLLVKITNMKPTYEMPPLKPWYRVVKSVHQAVHIGATFKGMWCF